MPDGSFFNMHIDEGQLYIGIDTNGNKRPNQFGHDIEYEYQKERKGNPCSLTSNQKANGIGCAYYALRDECPNSPGKSYFNCLP